MYDRAARDRVYHQVERGQTLWGIAQAYGVELQVLARANNISDTDTLYVGQKLYIPGATQQRAVASRCPCNAKEDEAADKRTTPKSRHVPPKSSPPSSAQDQDSAVNIRLMWPLQGVITRDFAQGQERRHDGIDIAAPQDTPILAAADGKVIYSDWGPGGYGRIVILQHRGDVVTVYAHTQRNLVRVGDVVRQGDHIATVGKTGRATSYHLHFEVRRKTVPVSPFLFLSHERQIARAASR
jgi:murein DD-endopeptidase MepM/ murein hydrolase activator NlpD